MTAATAHWQTSDYDFDPYALTAEKLSSPFESKAASDDTGGTGAKGKAVADESAAAGGSGAPKRRPGRQKRTSVLCQVPGCAAELVDAKKYYRRYRICLAHCNISSMMIEGRRQRFCQQCGRFHDIGEFEGLKRSCKRKLKRHNERRRTNVVGGKKGWQSDTEEEDEEMYAGDSSETEEKAVKRRTRRQQPARQKATALAPPPAAAAVPCGNASGSGSHSSAASQDTSGGAAVAVACCAPSLPASPACAAVAVASPQPEQPQPRPSAAGKQLIDSFGSLDSSSNGSGGSTEQQVAATALPLVAPHAEAALLPGLQPKAEPLEFQAGPLPIPAQAPPGAASTANRSAEVDLDSVLQELLQDPELQGLQLDPLEMFLPPNPSSSVGHPAVKAEPANYGPPAPTMPTMAMPGQAGWGADQFPGSFGLPLGLLDEIPLIPLPEELSGGAGTAMTAGTFSAASGHSSATNTAAAPAAGAAAGNCPSAGPVDMALPLSTVEGILRQEQAQNWRTAAKQKSDVPAAASMQPSALAAVLAGVDPGVLASAQGMISATGQVSAGRAAPLVGYSQDQVRSDRITCLSLKVFNCTPDRLLPTVRQELESLLQVGETLLEGCIRPGCTHLTLNALMTRERTEELRARGLGAMVHDLLASSGSSDVLQQDMLVQFEGELAVVKHRKLVAMISLKNSPALVPVLAPLLPVAVCGAADVPAAAWLLLRRRHLCDDQDLVLARQQGRHLTVEMHGCGEVQGGEYAKVRVLGLLPGFADLEIQHGTFLSAPRALLVLPSQAAVDEVRQLEHSAQGVDSVDDLLRDMGLVVQYLQRHELEAEGRPCPSYTPALLACIAAKARYLVAMAVARGWTAVTEMLLPAVRADGKTGAEAVAAMNTCCPPGMTLLHVAVGTGIVPLLQLLAAWAVAADHIWQVDARGNRGVTPLHVAALLPNCAAVRAQLAAMAPTVSKLWCLLEADDGTTPETLADAVQAAATTSAAKDVAPASAEGQDSSADTCATAGASSAGGLVPGGKPSGSKAAMARIDEEQSVLSNAPQVVPLPEGLLEAAKRKVGGDEGRPSCYSTQRQRGRMAMKQHLDDLHMSTILSEVETGLDSTQVRDPRPLANAINSTVAMGTALLRALGYRSQRP